MTIGSISGYQPYMPSYSYGATDAAAQSGSVSGVQGVGGSVTGTTGTSGKEKAGETGAVKNPGESTEVKVGRRSSPAECQTCKERKYQDGSDENVSFKSAQHIDPNAAAGRVRSHEQEHVANAYSKAAEKGGKVVSCSVSIKTAICPECGRSYVAGGLTSTQIRYPNEKNPYQKNLKSSDAANKFLGANIDLAG